jgi:hypothetical protein
LRDLADLARGQELRNLAAEGIEALETALSQQAAESPPGTGEPGANSSASPGASPGGEGSPGEGAPGASGDPGEGESGAEPGEAGPGQGGAGDQAPGQGGEGVPGLAGSPEAMAGGDSGLTPAGLGLSPAVKTGLETFLEVQLERVVTQARSTESSSRSGSQTDGRLEVTTSQERSGLDYRSVPSELSPAEQALLEQDRIPPRYRNMIREYFQIIREPMP